VQDTGLTTTHDKPGALLCPVYDTQEQFYWEEPVHIYRISSISSIT